MSRHKVEGPPWLLLKLNYPSFCDFANDVEPNIQVKFMSVQPAHLR